MLAVTMAVRSVLVGGVAVGAKPMIVVGSLRLADLIFEADQRHAVLAAIAAHPDLALVDLRQPADGQFDQTRVAAEMAADRQLDRGVALAPSLDHSLDPANQHTGEQEVGHHQHPAAPPG